MGIFKLGKLFYEMDESEEEILSHFASLIIPVIFYLACSRRRCNLFEIFSVLRLTVLLFQDLLLTSYRLLL